MPKIDTSVPPPPIPSALDAYQTWALQWTYYQQAQQAAAYQNQLYQSFANQQTPTPVPPVNNNASNGFNSQQQTNTTPTKWQQQSKNFYRNFCFVIHTSI